MGPASGEGGDDGQLYGAQKGSPCSSPKLMPMIHQLQGTQEGKVRGGGCVCMEDQLQLHLGTVGAAGIGDGEKPLVFNSTLVTAAPENTATCRCALPHGAGPQPTRQGTACACAAARMVPQLEEDPGMLVVGLMRCLTAVFKKRSCHGNCYPGFLCFGTGKCWHCVCPGRVQRSRSSARGACAAPGHPEGPQRRAGT